MGAWTKCPPEGTGISVSALGTSVHVPAVKRGEMIFVLVQNLEIPGGRGVAGAAAADWRLINDLPILKQEGFLRAEIDIDRERSGGVGRQRAGE